MIDIKMPQLGESVTEGTITAWRKQPGDSVELDEYLCDVSTDKVVFEVPAPEAGKLIEILATEGAVVPVGDTIARLEVAGAPAGTASSSAPTNLRASDTVALASMPGGAGAPNDGRFSPLVRRIASENGIDLGAVRGSGQNGRVTRADVMALVNGKPAQQSRPPPQAAPAAAERRSGTPAAAASMFKAVPMKGDRVEPFTLMRQRTADHMSHSARVAPHGYVSFEVDYGAVDTLRRERKDDFKNAHGISLTYLPFVIRAVCLALRQFPLVNSAVGDDELIVRGAISIGVAVDLSYNGLMVPVIRNADTYNLVGLAKAIADLAARARAGKPKPEDLGAGTFTVTNPGPSGTYMSVPIINHPQTAILVTDGVERRPAVLRLPDGSEVIGVRPKGSIGLSMDHRAFDGAYAADFLRAVKKLIEERDWDNEF